MVAVLVRLPITVPFVSCCMVRVCRPMRQVTLLWL